MSQELIRKAREIEENAANSYIHALGVLRLYGVEIQDLEKVIKKVVIEIIIHKELMDGVLKAYEEAMKKEMEVLKGLGELEPAAKEGVLIMKLLKEHLIIEDKMINTYKELAAKIPYQVIKDLILAFVRNEEEHHRFSFKTGQLYMNAYNLLALCSTW